MSRANVDTRSRGRSTRTWRSAPSTSAPQPAQHSTYVDALRLTGAKVVRLPFLHGAYDSVFIKDPALLFERRGVKRALLAQPRHRERQPERLARGNFYGSNGYDVISDDTVPPWEGGDVVMAPGGEGMFLGHGPRSGREASRWLEKHAGFRSWPIELCDPYLYHLDMALSILPDGCALVCESALTRQSMRLIERSDAVRSIVVVQREDALAFGLNLVAVGNRVVCGADVPRISAVLRSRGYHVDAVPLDQFHLAGGSAACLVAAVHSDSRPADQLRPVEQPAVIRGGRPVESTADCFATSSSHCGRPGFASDRCWSAGTC